MEDEWTKEGLAIEVDGRIRSGRVIEVLSRLVSERGAPLYLRSDNGPEFVSRALLSWIASQGMQGHSKNPAGYECDDPITILAVIFSCLRHGHAS